MIFHMFISTSISIMKSHSLLFLGSHKQKGKGGVRHTYSHSHTNKDYETFLDKPLLII